MKTGKNLRAEKLIGSLAASLTAIFAITALFFFIQFMFCFVSAKNIPGINNYPLVRVMVYGSSYEQDRYTVSARISLLDSDSTEFAVIERSWKGTSLSILFLGASFSEKTVWFPFCVSGNDAAEGVFNIGRKGTKLSPYYNENGLCLLFGSRNTEKLQRSLMHLFAYAAISRFRPSSKHSVQKEINLAECENGANYTIYTDFTGTLFMSKD